MKKMKKVLCMMFMVALMMSCISVDAEAAVKYKTYTNKRFSYKVKYPSGLTKKSDYENLDGAKYGSSDGTVALEIWNSYGASKRRNGKVVVANAKKNRKIKIVKNTKKEGSYSYTEGKNITHYYHYFTKNGEISFKITYPKSQKKYYAEAVNGMSKSVKKHKKLVLVGN